MAQWAMLELQVVKLALKCLVLACLAGIVLFRKNTLTACNTRGEMTAAIFTVDVAI
jgi:hypothetical protein